MWYWRMRDPNMTGKTWSRLAAKLIEIDWRAPLYWNYRTGTCHVCSMENGENLTILFQTVLLAGSGGRYSSGGQGTTATKIWGHDGRTVGQPQPWLSWPRFWSRSINSQNMFYQVQNHSGFALVVLNLIKHCCSFTKLHIKVFFAVKTYFSAGNGIVTNRSKTKKCWTTL